MKAKARIVAGALAFACRMAIATDFHVAPDGDDANPGTRERPFASPVRARDAMRAARRAGDRGPFSVVLRGGTYALAETLVLGPEDSGTATAPVVWRAAPDEMPVLSGGREVRGLRESGANGVRRWTAQLPDAQAGGRTFRQLFVSSGGRPFERRYRPHAGMRRVDGLTYSPRRNAARHRAAQIDFYFAPGDLKRWEHLSDVEILLLHVWSSSRLLVRDVDVERNIVTFTGMPTFAVDQGGLQPYFIENIKEELDSPGEWYLDRPTGVLTYLPRDGETLENTRVVAPALSRVVALRGDYGRSNFVSHVFFEKLGFAFNDSPLPREGYGGSQGQPDLGAAVEFAGARDCGLRRCTVSQTGNYGVGIGLGCHDNQIIGCRLFDLGGGGVKIGEMGMKPAAEYPELPSGNSIANCAIFDGGIMYYSANAVWAGIVRGTVIRNNRIWNFPYSGIAVGWSWSDRPTSCGANRIEWNHISNVLTLIADGASIYTLGRQPGTVIRGNVVRDNVKSPFAREHWQLGLYLDEGSSGILVEKNLVYRVGTHGFNMNGGAENIIRNNILGPVFGNHAPYIRCHRKPYARGNVFTRNISYCDSENMADAAWDKALMACSANIYWNFKGGPMKFLDKSFAEWQAGGQDAGSLNADPLFEDPANGDFRLKGASPAFALGFEAFDSAAAGLERDFQDVGAPAKTVRPPVYAMKLPEPKPFTGFSADLEDIPAGMVPRGFSCSGATADTHFQVGDGVGKSGGRALVATDRQSASKRFYPYLTYRFPDHLAGGALVFSCDVMQKPGAPATLEIGFRDYSRRANPKKEFVSSPGVVFAADGAIKCGDSILARAAAGAWTHMRIEVPLAGAAREALIAVTPADGAQRSFRAAVSAEFGAASSLGFYCSDAIDGVCYLDNLRLAVEE